MIICGTGHRPTKLGGYGYKAQSHVIDIAVEGLRAIKPAKVISGMALGWDQAVAAAAIQLGIPFIAAVPFEGQEKMWPTQSQTDFKLLTRKAADVVYVCEPGYAPWKMQKRNEWMVDNADSVLALWNGTPGGTANCIKYAEKAGKPITNLWSQYKGYTKHDPRDFFNEDFDGMDMP